MTGLVQRLLDRAAPVPDAAGQAATVAPSASPLAAHDQRLGSGLVDDAGLGIGAPDATRAEDTGTMWPRVGAGVAETRHVVADEAATDTASDPASEDPPRADPPADGPAPSMAAPGPVLDGPAPLAPQPHAMDRPASPKAGNVDPDMTPSADPGAPQVAEPARSDLPPDALPQSARNGREPAPTGTATAPGHGVPAEPAPVMITPDGPIPVEAGTHPDVTIVPPAADPVAVVPEPVESSDAPQPDATPRLAMPVAPAPHVPPATLPQDAPVPQTRIVERVIRETPADTPDNPPPRGPLTADSVSKIGKLPDRRRVHTLFGRRRR